MLSLTEIQDRLGRMCIARVARETGIHYNVVYRIAKGMTKNPGVRHIETISEWMEK